jgi:hypothetical protein
MRFVGRLALLGMLLPVAVDAQPATAVDRLAWLTGCWEMTRPNGIVEEQWTRPKAGTMFGTSRTIRRDTVIAYEFLRIYARGDTLVYDSQPSGQARTEFVAPPASASDAAAGRVVEIVFANPAHDFPQRIVYRRVGRDSLAARIEGTMNGQQRASSFPYKRVACAG